MRAVTSLIPMLLIGMLVNAEILPDDADPCPLQTVRIEKLSIVRREMAITLTGGRIS